MPRVKKRILPILSILLLIAFGSFLSRDSFHSLLSDLTGEEDLEWQVRGLGYLVVSWFQPPRATADFAPLRYTDLSPFGINTFLEQEVEESKVRQSLELIRAAGIHWIRQEFPWEDIEKPGKGQFWDTKYNHSTWDKYDRIVALTQEYDIEIVARLDHPPAWTRHDGRARGDFAPPDDLEDFGDFVAAVVERYKGKIRFYQLWNEPNIYPEWGEQDVSPADYVRLLKIGYTRAKSVDPQVTIISGSLAQTVEQSSRGLNDRLFLEQMYDAGARGYFDIVAVNDYGLFSGPGDRRLDEQDRINFSRPIQLREIMVKNGDANTPIWAMEIGWNALPSHFENAPYGRVDEKRQALYAVKAYERARKEWPWMGPMMYWFFRRANDSEKNQPWYYFRMLEPDFTPHPVYNALGEYTPNARLVSIGFHSLSHWAVDRVGAWETESDDRAYFGEYLVGSKDSELSFRFDGTDLDLVAMQNPYGGQVRVEIDNRSPRLIDLWKTDSGTSGRIALVRDLQDGNHRVRLTVTRGPVALNGIIIQRGNGWLYQRGAWAVGAGVLLGGLFFWTRVRSRISS